MIKGRFIDAKWLSGSIAKSNINPSDLCDAVGERYAPEFYATVNALISLEAGTCGLSNI